MVRKGSLKATQHGHGEDCVCRDRDCIKRRKILKEWPKELQSLLDANDESSRITEEDLAIIVDT